jgi:hypothetical protein
MLDSDGGSQSSAGQDCPAHRELSGGGQQAKRSCEDGERGAFDEVTADEQAAIKEFLKQPGAVRPRDGRGASVVRAALKLAGVVLLAAGVVGGYADGDDSNDVGCTVAQQAGGDIHEPAGQPGGKPGGKVPRPEGTGVGGACGGGGSAVPECVARAERCTYRLRDGVCQISQQRCRLMPVKSEECRMQNEPASGAATEKNAESVMQNPPSADDVGAARVAEMVAAIHREIAAVRKEFGELRSAKETVEKMLAGGLFEFTRRVDTVSFKVLCAVLAEGDVAKAGRRLGMADGSVRTLMRRWRGMSKEYRAMSELVRWRKAVGRKETVPLNDQVLHGKADRTDYPGLIADVLEKVTEMTGENWRKKAGELEEMLRPVTQA